MFARYIGEAGFGLIPNEIYYINIAESLAKQQVDMARYEIRDMRRLTISVGDYWANDYSSFGEAMTEWEFTQWVKEHAKLAKQ